VLLAPRWADVLLVTTLAAGLAGALVMSTAVGQQALLDQLERTADAVGRPLDDAGYARLQSLSVRAPWYAAAMAVVNGPALTIAVTGLVVVAAGARRRRATFRQILAVVAHAGVILTLRQLVAAPLTYVRETTASATALGVWFPGLDEGAPLARFLGSLDLFVLWWAVVLGVGLAAAYQIRTRRAVAMVIGSCVVVALAVTIVTTALGNRS
jgi:hypothetical protein